MVSIDYRLHYGVKEQQIIDMFKSLDYIHIRKKKKALKKGGNWISAEEFIKIYENGRFHIFVEFSTKSSGTEAYPQVDVHAHYDYFKKKGEKEVHITRKNILRDLDEMFDIHGALKKYSYGYMEYKSSNSAHDTIKNTYLKCIVAELNRDYQYDKDGKYKKKLSNGQITIQIIEQRRYSHIVCVYAIGKKHDLFRDKALDELDRIMDNVFEKINDAKKKYKELKPRLKKDTKKLNELKEIRDSKNVRTKELISQLKDLEQEINDCTILKKKEILGYKKRKLERKLIKNKNNANEDHEKYRAFKKEVEKLRKEMKKHKV